MTPANAESQQLEERVDVLENFIKEHVATKEQVEELKQDVDEVKEDVAWTKGKVNDIDEGVKAIRTHLGI